MIPTFLDDYTYQVSSPYNAFNLLAVANMSEKTPLDLRGCTPSFGVPRKLSYTHLKISDEKSLAIGA